MILDNFNDGMIFYHQSQSVSNKLTELNQLIRTADDREVWKTCLSRSSVMSPLLPSRYGTSTDIYDILCQCCTSTVSIHQEATPGGPR